MTKTDDLVTELRELAAYSEDVERYPTARAFELAAARIQSDAAIIEGLRAVARRADRQFSRLAEMAAKPDVQSNKDGMALALIFGLQRACADWSTYRARQALSLIQSDEGR